MTLAIPTRLTSADHGRRMSLVNFENVETDDECRFELSRGLVVVSEVPNPAHGEVVFRLTRAFILYQATYAAAPTFSLRGGTDSKLLIPDLETERHPDVAIYKTPAPAADSTAWRTWIPEIVIEVVSESSVERDYVLKVTDYLELGAAEYWIVDPHQRTITQHVRQNDKWEVASLRDGASVVTTQLPGLSIAVSALFDAPPTPAKAKIS